MEFVSPYSKSKEPSIGRYNQFLQPFFYINPERIEFNGKMYLYTQKVLEKQLYESRSHFEVDDSMSLKCCLIYKFLSFIFFAKRIQWAHKITQVLLDYHLQTLRSPNEIVILDNPKDQVHLLTSILSGLFKMDQNNKDEQARIVKSVFVALPKCLKSKWSLFYRKPEIIDSNYK